MSALWAVMPAAGSGSRMSRDEKKQFLSLHGRSLLEWSTASLLVEPSIRVCMVVLPEPEFSACRASYSDPRLQCCLGGATRANSVLNGLVALPAEDDDWVLVHDAARPCLPLVDLRRLIDRVQASAIGGLLAQPVTDTLKRAGPDGRVNATVSREGLWRAQTPQMFRVSELRSALTSALENDLTVTDEASAMELAGFRVQLVEGSAANLKVTFPQDLAMAEFLLGDAQADNSRAAVGDNQKVAR